MCVDIDSQTQMVFSGHDYLYSYVLLQYWADRFETLSDFWGIAQFEEVDKALIRTISQVFGLIVGCSDLMAGPIDRRYHR